jgi:hypothetical protein
VEHDLLDGDAAAEGAENPEWQQDQDPGEIQKCVLDDLIHSDRCTVKLSKKRKVKNHRGTDFGLEQGILALSGGFLGTRNLLPSDERLKTFRQYRNNGKIDTGCRCVHELTVT